MNKNKEKTQQGNLDLSREKNKFKSFVDLFSEPVIEININFDIIYRNPAFENLFGGNSVPENLFDFITQAGIKSIEKQIKKNSPNSISCSFNNKHKKLKNRGCRIEIHKHTIRGDEIYWCILKITHGVEYPAWIKKVVNKHKSGAVFYNNEGEIVFVNKEWAKMHSYRAPVLYGKKQDLFYPKDALSKYNNFINTVKQNGFHNVVIKQKTKDSKEFTCKISGMLVPGEDNIPLGTLITGHEIFEDIMDTLKLYKEKEFIDNVLNSLPHPFYVVDAENYEVILSNQAAKMKTLLGRKKCKAIRAIISDKSTIKEKKEEIIPFEVLKTTKKHVVAEYKIDNPDNTYTYYEVRCYPLFDENGEIFRIIEYNLDITKRKKAESQIKESEAKFRTLTENISNGVAVVINSKITWVNQAFKEMFGRMEIDIYGETLKKIIISSEFPDFEKNVDKIVKGNIGSDSFDTIGISNNGNLISLIVSVKEIVYGGEKAYQYLFEDVTQRKEAEKLTIIQRDLAIKLAASVNLDETIQHCMEAALRASAMDSGGVYLIDRKTHELKLSFYEGLSEKSVSDFVRSVKGGRKYIECSKNSPQFLSFSILPESLKKNSESPGIKSLGVIPIIHERETIACLVVVSHSIETIPQNSKSSIEAIVAQIGSTMSRLMMVQALRHNEELFRTLYENISDVILIVDENLKMKFISGSVERISGYNPVELMFDNFFKIIQKNDISLFMDSLSIVMETPGKESVVQISIMRKDGEIRIIENLMVNRFDKPYIRGIIVNTRDITERKIAEQALIESEERYRSVVENAIDAIIIIAQGKFQYVNKAFVDLTGYSENEVLNKPVEIMLATKTENNYNDFDEILSLFNSGQSKKQIDIKLLKKNKDIIDVILGGSKIKIENQEVFIAMFKDITEAKRATAEREKLIKTLENKNIEIQGAYKRMHHAYENLEAVQYELRKANEDLHFALEKAEEANKQKSEFLAIMSHELRTPLTGILGFSQLLSNDTTITPRQKEFSDRVNKLGNKLLYIINDLLELSIIESGKVKIEYTYFDINDLINDIYSIFEEQTKHKDVKFSIKTNNVLNIYSDPLRLRQILFNIIGNAFKFTNKGFIQVELKKNNDFYVFSVADTGIGIDEHDREYIFEMFRQAEIADTRKYSGSGLGLAICNKLVNMLGGRIWVKSKKDKGSTFFFTIPVLKEENGKKINYEEQIIAEINGEKKCRILFAEDNENNFLFIKEVLSEYENFLFRGFNDGIPLLEEFKKNQDYDLILLDIQMLEMGGYETLKNIRKISKDIPVVAISAFATENDKNDYIKHGFDDFISKPIEIDSFINKINNLCR